MPENQSIKEVTKSIKAVYTLLLLLGSNVFMTLAWYGHLKFKEIGWAKDWGLFTIILISWGLAFFEYCLQVPANRIGFKDYGGPFSLIELKIIQEVITLLIFTLITILFFKSEPLRWNHLIAFFCLILAVYFTFKK
ncbi:DMT family protein [soil metagenome]